MSDEHDYLDDHVVFLKRKNDNETLLIEKIDCKSNTIPLINNNPYHITLETEQIL
jgi:hypothetical protein